MGNNDRNRRSTTPRFRYVRRSRHRRLNRDRCVGFVLGSPSVVGPCQSARGHKDYRARIFGQHGAARDRSALDTWCTTCDREATLWSLVAFLAVASIVVETPGWCKGAVGAGLVVLVLSRVIPPRLRYFLWTAGATSVAALVVLRPGLQFVRYVDAAGNIRSVSAVSYRAPWSGPPRVGEVVLRRVRGSSLGQVELAFDRVLAVPGERVRVAHSRSQVHAESVCEDAQPLGPIPPELEFDRVLGPGQFAVIPSLVRWRPSGPEPEDAILGTLARESIVNASDILGSVVIIHWGGPTPIVS